MCSNRRRWTGQHKTSDCWATHHPTQHGFRSRARQILRFLCCGNTVSESLCARRSGGRACLGVSVHDHGGGHGGTVLWQDESRESMPKHTTRPHTKMLASIKTVPSGVGLRAEFRRVNRRSRHPRLGPRLGGFTAATSAVSIASSDNGLERRTVEFEVDVVDKLEGDRLPSSAEDTAVWDYASKTELERV